MPRSPSRRLEWHRIDQPSRAKANPQSWPHPCNCARLEVDLESSFVPSLPLLLPYGVCLQFEFSPAVDPLSLNGIVHPIGLALSTSIQLIMHPTSLGS